MMRLRKGSRSWYVRIPHAHNISLPIGVIYRLCFLTAYKLTSLHSIVAWASDSKNPDLYYCSIDCYQSLANLSPRSTTYVNVVWVYLRVVAQICTGLNKVQCWPKLIKSPNTPVFRHWINDDVFVTSLASTPTKYRVSVLKRSIEQGRWSELSIEKVWKLDSCSCFFASLFWCSRVNRCWTFSTLSK